MKVKELNCFKSKMYDEIIKIDEVKKALKFTNIVYVYEIREKNKHIITTFNYLTQLNNLFLEENGFTKNAFIQRLYTIDRTQKIVF